METERIRILRMPTHDGVLEEIPVRWPGRPSGIMDEVTVLSHGGYIGRYRHLRIFVSEALARDGRWWTVVAVSRRDRMMPSYDDLMTARRLTIGEDRLALQLLGPASEHVDIAERAPRPVQFLPLWAPCEDIELPDFRRMATHDGMIKAIRFDYETVEEIPVRWPGRPSDLMDDVTVLFRGGYIGRYRHLRIFVSEALERDGRWWTLVSVSRRDRMMPSYDDLMTARRLTIGEDRLALQLLVPASEHVDIAGRAPRPVQFLHLWAPCEDIGLPDFSHGGQI